MKLMRGLQPGPALDACTPILVLRRSTAPFQHSTLAVARSLGRLGVPVYVMRHRAYEPASSSRYISGVLPFPPNAPEPEWIDALEALGARFAGAILLPIDDLASILVGDHQDRLAKTFRLPLAPGGIQRRLASKRELWRLCGELDLPTPGSTFPADESELVEQAEAHGYPVVLKRAELWFAPRDPAAPSVAIVNDRRELLRAYARMESDLRPQVMVQEHIPGDSDSVWIFNGYAGAEAECLCAFTGRKLRQSGPRTGPTTLGVCEANGEVVDLARRLLRALDYRGIVDMGFRHDARDGAYKLLDVNPRLGSTFRLFVSDDGLDVVRALHLDLTGRPVPWSTISDGRKWIDERSDLVTSVRMTRRGMLGPRSWARSLRGITEGAWWAADDPLPLLSMSATFPPHALRRLAGAGRGAGARQSIHRDHSDRAPGAADSISGPAPASQQRVDRFFDGSADYWNAVYDGRDLTGRIYQRRMLAAVAWTGELGLAPGAPVLDVGCGAGLMTAQLARAGFTVTGTDSSLEMVHTAGRLLGERGLAASVTLCQADVHRLPFADGEFELVVALGVLPWLHDPATAVAELARVLAPGGWMILTADNRHRLNRLVEPRENPLLSPLRPVKRALRHGSRNGSTSAPSHRHRPREVDELLAGAGIAVAWRTTIGYGPFTALGRPVLPDRIGTALDERLQRAAADRWRLRGAGWHYVLAGVRGSASA